jgi:hypothetical protein
MRHALSCSRRGSVACAIAAGAQGGTARLACDIRWNCRAGRRAGAGNPPAGGPVLEIHTGRGAVRRPVTAAVGVRPLADRSAGCPRPGGCSPGPVAHADLLGGWASAGSRGVGHQVQLRTVCLLVGVGWVGLGVLSPGPVAHRSPPSQCGVWSVVFSSRVHQVQLRTSSPLPRLTRGLSYVSSSLRVTSVHGGPRGATDRSQQVALAPGLPASLTRTVKTARR